MLKVAKVAPEIQPAFSMFARNGRWGTCGACPKDSKGNALPELCAYTDRQDHQGTIEELLETHKIYRRDLVKQAIRSVLEKGPLDIVELQNEMDVSFTEIKEVLDIMYARKDVIMQGKKFVLVR